MSFLDGFGYKQEDRFECKSGDAFGSQRRFPQQMFWDYKVGIISRGHVMLVVPDIL